MLENSFSLTFFLKRSKRVCARKLIYLRIKVDNVTKEVSTQRRCEDYRWDQTARRVIGEDNDAATTNKFLELIELKISQYKNELFFANQSVTAVKLIGFVLGKNSSRGDIIKEFQLHNDRLLALVRTGEYAKGTHLRFETSKNHLVEFLRYKFNVDKYEFRDLSYEFITDYEHYLKTIKNIGNNTALRYITNFKKIVFIAIDKEIISFNPFRSYKTRKIKVLKKPLSRQHLESLENYRFTNVRLARVRNVFIFQCYTGLAYIDGFNLKPKDIRIGIDGEKWIISERQKTKKEITIPLLPQALEIIERYKEHPICKKRGSLLPVNSNQKMNAYLKEISDLCDIDTLNTHKARRTFASTVTLANDVPIHVVKEMLGHHSVQQTEVYAITEQQAIGKEMQKLKGKLSGHAGVQDKFNIVDIAALERDFVELKKKVQFSTANLPELSVNFDK